MNPRTAVAILAIAAGVALTVAAGGAEAKGCIKGAIVGGVAGHLAHHGVLGAAGGCVVGHHMATQRERQAEQQRLDDHRPVDEAR